MIEFNRVKHLFYTHSSRMKFEADVKLCSRHLDDKNILKSEQLYLQSTKISPYDPENYIKLYKLYSIQNQTKKAEFVRLKIQKIDNFNFLNYSSKKSIDYTN